MGEWLKNKWKDILTNGFVSILCVMIAFWAYGWRDKTNAEEKRISNLEATKADVTYVDKENSRQDEQIGTKASKEVVNSIDEKLNLIIELVSNQ